MSNEKNQTIKSRQDIPEKYRWQLEDIFASDDAWEATLLQIPQMQTTVTGYKGRLSEDPERLAAALEASEKLEKLPEVYL